MTSRAADVLLCGALLAATGCRDLKPEDQQTLPVDRLVARVSCSILSESQGHSCYATFHVGDTTSESVSLGAGHTLRINGEVVTAQAGNYYSTHGETVPDTFSFDWTLPSGDTVSHDLATDQASLAAPTAPLSKTGGFSYEFIYENPDDGQVRSTSLGINQGSGAPYITGNTPVKTVSGTTVSEVYTLTATDLAALTVGAQATVSVSLTQTSEPTQEDGQPKVTLAVSRSQSYSVTVAP